jgi:hypothetical protein
MSHRPTFAVALLVALVLAVALPLRAARAGRTSHSCTAAGATWKWKVRSGHEYRIFPSGTTCAFARAWASRLTYEPLVSSGGERVIRGGPKGWSCRVRFPFPFARAWAGSCAKGAEAFAWLPLLPKAAIGP